MSDRFDDEAKTMRRQITCSIGDMTNEAIDIVLAAALRKAHDDARAEERESLADFVEENAGMHPIDITDAIRALKEVSR